MVRTRMLKCELMLVVHRPSNDAALREVSRDMLHHFDLPMTIVQGGNKELRLFQASSLQEVAPTRVSVVSLDAHTAE